MPTSSRAILLKSYLYVNPNISKVLLFFITVFQEFLFPYSSHMTLYFFAIKIFNESLKNNLGRTCIILRPFLLIYAQFRLVCPRDILVDASRIASVCIVIIIAKLPCSFQGSRARLIPGLFSSTQVEWKDIFIWLHSWFEFQVDHSNPSKTLATKIFNPEEQLYCMSSVLEKCLEFTKLKNSDINKRQ